MSKNFLLGHYLKLPTYPKNCFSDLISAFDCVLSSSDRLITPINYYKTHHQPNSFTHSYKFIVLGSLGPYPIPSGFGLQFVTLQCFFIKLLQSNCIIKIINWFGKLLFVHYYIIISHLYKFMSLSLKRKKELICSCLTLVMFFVYQFLQLFNGVSHSVSFF